MGFMRNREITRGIIDFDIIHIKDIKEWREII